MPLTKVSFGDSGLPGYEAGDKSSPALIVIQEWWGVNDQIQELALKLQADSGLRVLIPDLYKGKVGVNAEEASHLMNALDFKAAVGELKQAAGYLRSSGSPKVGITGFCMGGALTLAALSEGLQAECGAPFYGVPSPEYFQVEKITSVPVLATFGEHDQYKGFADVETARGLESKIKGAGGTIDLKIYPGAGHAFMNVMLKGGKEQMEAVGNVPVPSEEVVADAYQRLLAFLKQHLP